ncbi:hypothetical protein PNOK_0424300 [Pyrrhoderma noxium]|uniref:Uncharacterized protein n=1 Tax=Pyrrhoderma noxium TaxID=2282107 RepID=A0A286UIG5_9AGAM|nr:hypothetical protein PNOK_0424300 [Pyrrhoderma noxium]
MSFSASESKTTTSQASKGSAISFIDWLKPRRSVAIARLRHNGFALAVALIFTQLAPVVPSPLSCLFMVLVDDRGLTKAEAWMCRIELALFSILSLNILQAYLGLRYPPPPCDPLETPAKKNQARNPPTPRPLSKVFTPITPFKNASLASSYANAPSPVSSPSRIINYKSPLFSSTSTSSPFQTSLNSSTHSTSSFMSSPLAYRARQSLSQSARPLSGSFLGKLETEDDDF